MPDAQPLKLDIKKLTEALKIDPKVLTECDDEIKKANYQVTPDMAKELLVKFWSYKSMLTEWVTKAKKFEREAELAMKFEFSKLKAQAPETSEAGRTRWAEEQATYQDAQVTRMTATIFREHLDMKRDDLREGHYMCKAIMDSLKQDWSMGPGGPDRHKDI